MDRYTVPLPPGTPSGVYQLILVLYDASGERWQVSEGGEFVELRPGIEVVEQGIGKPGVGSGEWGMEIREWGLESREWAQLIANGARRG